RAFAAGQGFQRRLILAELGERNLGGDARLPARQRVVAVDAAPDAGEVARDLADTVARRRDLELRDRLEDDRSRLRDRVEEGPPARLDERDLFRVDRMVLAVVDRDSHILDR